MNLYFDFLSVSVSILFHRCGLSCQMLAPSIRQMDEWWSDVADVCGLQFGV